MGRNQIKEIERFLSLMLTSENAAEHQHQKQKEIRKLK